MEEKQLLLDRTPQIHPTAFVAPGAVLIGDVRLEEEASVWFNCVLRGDVHYIVVGKRSNIQDLSVCHGILNKYPVIIGEEVTIGHGCIIHGCTIGDRCLIGMGAIILSGAVIGEGSVVAAGAVVKERFVVPPNSLVVGVPAKVKRQLTDKELNAAREYNLNYQSYTVTYRRWNNGQS